MHTVIALRLATLDRMRGSCCTLQSAGRTLREIVGTVRPDVTFVDDISRAVDAVVLPEPVGLPAALQEFDLTTTCSVRRYGEGARRCS
jgi:hypothetical protein